VFSSAGVSVSDSLVASFGYVPTKAFDAVLPATVMGVLRQNGLYADAFVGDNLARIDTAQFRVAWWYRSEFKIDTLDDGFYELDFEGINYKAEVWINGKLVDNTLESPYRRFQLDVSHLLKSGVNVLAVKILPPQKSDLSIGFVDWNPPAPDLNMGIWRPVGLHKTRGVRLRNLFVESDFELGSIKTASLRVGVDVENLSAESREVSVSLLFGKQVFARKVSLLPGDKTRVFLDATDFGALRIVSPKLWWPNGMGAPNLYHLAVTAAVDGVFSDRVETDFGVRKIEQYLTPTGDKGWKVNGEKVLVKGAGWVDDLFLTNDSTKVQAQVAYAKHMNLNLIRLEGFWGSTGALYDYADRNGILLMVGWSCQWEWNAYCHRPEDQYIAIRTPEDMALQTQGYIDQVLWLRNHPSVLMWVYGSDKLPVPALEDMLNKALEVYDPSRPTLASCKGWDYGTAFANESPISGPTGVKMLGPYSYVGPSYWYTDTLAGGAFGFNTETGPGPQVPPLVSLRQMLPKDKLWPINATWDYHCGRNEFGSLNMYTNAMAARYGASHSVEDYAKFAQLTNYEAMRPMFEAFAANRPKSTGVVQWMLNSAWPEMYWQLYDWYLVPNGAFYGAQNGCKPINVIYNYATNSLHISNETLVEQRDMHLSIRIMNTESVGLWQSDTTIQVLANTSKVLLKLPQISLPKTYFLVLKLTDNKQTVLADKWYWLSKQPDTHDFAKTTWVGTPIAQYADLTALRTLRNTHLKVDVQRTETETDIDLKLQVTNATSSLAFFTEFRAIDGATNRWITPIFWSDNYLCLLPHETKNISVHFPKYALKGEIRLEYEGINSTPHDIKF
jgi:exo-1,4-beta-D-glucosaminidase